MSTASKPAGAGNVVASRHAITMPHKGDVHVQLPLPLPCITILVHGVNDVGEAYDAQETGLCAGLNARLDRAHGPGPHGVGDLVPAKYAMPPATPEQRRKEGIKADPDAVYFRRTADRHCWSPVIPFYWGSSESAGIDPRTGQPYIKKDNWHGQWTDRYGNRLDKNGSKNGGPFVNATTNLNALWSDGFNGKVMGLETVAGMAGDPMHNLKKAGPRLYMLLAAKRLAMLIKIIRNNASYKNAAINLVCHSQGSMIALTAHALLAEEGGKYAADTLILQDPPYSFEETNAEFYDGMTGSKQQTTQSRIKTLSNILHYINEKKSATPALSDLDFSKKTGRAVTGPSWKPGAGAKQWIDGKPYTFSERDNRGKVYLYFCPHDATVALMSVQGMGWNGVPDYIRAPEVRYAAQPREGLASTSGADSWHHDATLSVLSSLGEGFRQRAFTSRQVEHQPLLVGAPPARYEMRSADGSRMLLTEENSTTGNWSASIKQIERGATRQITGEALNPPVRAVLTTGEAGHAKRLAVSPIGAAIAIGAGEKAFNTDLFTCSDFRVSPRHGAIPLTADEIRSLEERLPRQRKGVAAANGDDRLRVIRVEIDKGALSCVHTTETPNEARARWQSQTDANSYHSAIPGNPAHAAGVTAYDLSLGAPLPVSEDDKAYMDYLRAVADWRTDWSDFAISEGEKAALIFKHLDNEKTSGAFLLVKSNTQYYKTGLLPSDIAKDNVTIQPERTA
jgi:hypothetical protein